jgi:type I restriction enzyme S subunit
MSSDAPEPDHALIGLPEGWTAQQLGQVARIVTGKTPSTKDDKFWNGGVPFVTPSDIRDSPWCDTVERHLSHLGATIASTAPAGAVLFTCIASIGKSCILSETSAFNQQINACIPGPAVDSYFLYSQLQAMADEIRHLAGTTAVPIINKSTFSAIPIWLPPYEEQRRIAEVLRSVDEAIAANVKLVGAGGSGNEGALVHVKQSLMCDLLSGSKRVPT